MRLKVKDVMTAEPVTVRPDLPFKEVADLLIEHGIGGVPVVDDHGAVLGVITETDLIMKPAYEHEEHGRKGLVRSLLAGRHRSWVETSTALAARDIMSAPPVTAAPWDDLEVVGRRLLKHRIGRLPVIDEGQLVGIVSRRDLVRQFHRSDAQIAADVEQALHDPLLFESSPRVAVAVDDGVVSLKGTVQYPHHVEAIGSLVAGIGGVVDVRNELTATDAEPSPPRTVPFPDEPNARY